MTYEEWKLRWDIEKILTDVKRLKIIAEDVVEAMSRIDPRR